MPNDSEAICKERGFMNKIAQHFKTNREAYIQTGITLILISMMAVAVLYKPQPEPEIIGTNKVNAGIKSAINNTAYTVVQNVNDTYQRIEDERIAAEEAEREAAEAAAEEAQESAQQNTQYSSNGNIDLRSAGVVNWGGYRFTWYSQNVLPGGGLDIPGRHVNSAGFVCDGDGFIVAASTYGRGTTGNSPWGAWKSYDTGVSGNTIDLYTNW